MRRVVLTRLFEVDACDTVMKQELAKTDATLERRWRWSDVVGITCHFAGALVHLELKAMKLVGRSLRLEDDLRRMFRALQQVAVCRAAGLQNLKSKHCGYNVGIEFDYLLNVSPLLSENDSDLVGWNRELHNLQKLVLVGGQVVHFANRVKNVVDCSRDVAVSIASL